MNRRKLLVILLVFGLLVGNLARVPVARAVVTGTVPGALLSGVGTYIYIVGGSCYVSTISGNFGETAWSGGQHFYIDGVDVGSGEPSGLELYPSGGTAICIRFPIPGSVVRNAAHTVTAVGGTYVIDSYRQYTIGNLSYSFNSLVDTGDWVDWGWRGVTPLSVSLGGAFTTQIGVPYTCTATASDGTAPYRYLFSIDWVTVIGGVNNYTAVYTGSLTSSGTFTYTFTFTGEFLIRVTALDSLDAEATDTLDLNAGVNKPALWGQIYDIPDGDALYTYINFKLFPASVSQENPPVANGAIQTQFYEITSPGTVEKGSVYYMLSPVLITALPNPLLIYVNYHDPVSGADWSYVFSFNTTGWAANSGAASNGDTWTGAETPGAFAWLWDLLVKLFRFLFVPSSTDFSAQIAEGWILIASPVPTITPQYTIPFPNPDHLLAPTGDSVNIDFSAISTWTYYATVKALVQVFLYAILVFIVIGIVS